MYVGKLALTDDREVKDVAPLVVQAAASVSTTVTFQSVISGIFAVIMDVVPILLIILFFQYGVLKKPIKNLKSNHRKVTI